MAQFSLRSMVGGDPAAIVIAARRYQKRAEITDQQLIEAMAIALAWVIKQRKVT